MEPPPLVSETLAAKRAAKAAATAAGAAGQLHHYHHQHHHQMHGLAGLARYNKGACCGSLSPSGPLSPTSSLTSLQVRRTPWVWSSCFARLQISHSLRCRDNTRLPDMSRRINP